jgi:hypothetical protein
VVLIGGETSARETANRCQGLWGREAGGCGI